jgi:hypothetical protein
MPLIRICGKAAGYTYHLNFELPFRPHFPSFTMLKLGLDRGRATGHKSCGPRYQLHGKFCNQSLLSRKV